MILPMDINGSKWLHLNQGDKLTTTEEIGGLPTGSTVTATGEHETPCGFVYIGIQEADETLYHLSCFDTTPYIKAEGPE